MSQRVETGEGKPGAKRKDRGAAVSERSRPAATGLVHRAGRLPPCPAVPSLHGKPVRFPLPEPAGGKKRPTRGWQESPYGGFSATMQLSLTLACLRAFRFRCQDIRAVYFQYNSILIYFIFSLGGRLRGLIRVLFECDNSLLIILCFIILHFQVGEVMYKEENEAAFSGSFRSTCGCLLKRFVAGLAGRLKEKPERSPALRANCLIHA